MLAPITIRRPTSVNITAARPGVSRGLSRVFSAAVVNKQFCELLLKDPQKALSRGYLGESFLLSKEEFDLILSIRASSLSDLARQVNRYQNGN